MSKYNLREIKEKFEKFCENKNCYGLHECDGYHDRETGEYIPEATFFYASNTPNTDICHNNTSIRFSHKWEKGEYAAHSPTLETGIDSYHYIIEEFYNTIQGTE